MGNCGCEELENLESQDEPCEGVLIKDLPTIDVLNLNDWLVVHDTSENAVKKVSIADLLVLIEEQINKISPTYVMYNNLTILEIPYTQILKNKYGTVPTVTVYDANNNVVALAFVQFDNVNNPTLITITTENPENLIIKIS